MARIVVASVAVGLGGALLLTLVAFVGATEHVITGTALLAFALGWATLAVLSTRMTNQPQRWALVPATAMAVTGLGILVLAPGHSTLKGLGWLWTPALLALAIWMIVQARRHLRSRTRVWLLYPVLGVLLVGAVGGGYETVRESVGASALTGQLVDVGSHRLHLRCTGTGSPTVVLEPGLGEISSAFGWIEPAVARGTRTCVYDRAGRGGSESTAGPLDGVQTARDLGTLLQRAHVPGPYVLAGHSIGGLYVLNFAALYPDRVAGLALLDSTPPDAFKSLPAYPAFYDGFRRISALFPTLARFGVGRVAYQFSYGGLPAKSRDEERDDWATPRHARSTRDEFAEAPTAMRQARSLETLGAKPLVVVTAGSGMDPGWEPAQNHLATLSTNSVHRMIPGATHAALLEDKAYAASSTQAILDVVAAVRQNKPLTSA
jgi:pimeloyl-ACP methyl ester carboxylesterase